MKDLDVLEENINKDLEEAFEAVRASVCVFPQSRFYENWKNFHGNYSHDPLKTGVSLKKLTALARKLNTVPSDFSLNTKLIRLLENRLKRVEKKENIDWANAEALAFGSLLTEGYTHPFKRAGQRPRHFQPAPQCSDRYPDR